MACLGGLPITLCSCSRLLLRCDCCSKLINQCVRILDERLVCSLCFLLVGCHLGFKGCRVTNDLLQQTHCRRSSCVLLVRVELHWRDGLLRLLQEGLLLLVEITKTRQGLLEDFLSSPLLANGRLELCVLLLTIFGSLLHGHLCVCDLLGGNFHLLGEGLDRGGEAGDLCLQVLLLLVLGVCGLLVLIKLLDAKGLFLSLLLLLLLQICHHFVHHFLDLGKAVKLRCDCESGKLGPGAFHRSNGACMSAAPGVRQGGKKVVIAKDRIRSCFTQCGDNTGASHGFGR
mmetsp:Transcript_6163/g.10719  ORF Transcript_6163/g.10719 Transcript_6163/m.10719 type:complete len:286 (-) Transcript_6163:1368-2225(-)